MKLSSAGLGKTELDAVIVGMKIVDDTILLAVDVTKPTKWHTRMGLQESDLRKLAWEILKPGNMWFILRALIFRPKNNPEPVKDGGKK
jgi:hypothetical protein